MHEENRLQTFLETFLPGGGDPVAACAHAQHIKSIKALSS